MFVVGADNVLKQRNIIPKLRFPDFYVVESGITEQEQFLFEGVENVKDGLKIHPTSVDPASVMPIATISTANDQHDH